MIYLDNGRQFVSKVSKAKTQKNGSKLNFGRPLSPNGCSKIKQYNKTHYREPIVLKEFRPSVISEKNSGIADPQYKQLAQIGAPGLEDPA
jgi:hypothetical protein